MSLKKRALQYYVTQLLLHADIDDNETETIYRSNKYHPAGANHCMCISCAQLLRVGGQDGQRHAKLSKIIM